MYEARPIQCSTYPFWSSIVSSESAWESEAIDCPGIGKGRLRKREDVEDSLYQSRKAGTIIVRPELAKRPELIDEAEILGS